MNLKPLALAGAGAAAALAAYAVLVEPRWLQVSRTRVHVRYLPPALEGLRVAVLTDLHVERGRAPAILRRAVAATMRARPDLVAITGDLAEGEAGLQEVLDALMPLSAPLGVFAVPGNHDHRAGIAAWHRALAARKAIVDLTNRSTTVRRDGVTVCIAGVDDFIEGSPRLVLPPPERRALTIVLAHSPDQAESCRRRYDAVDLIVSGHTHGGQVRFPFIGAPVSSAQRPDLYEDGLRRRPWTQVYTSRGLGTTRLPVRFLARPEVAILELTARPRPRLRPAPDRALEMPAQPAHIQPPEGQGIHPASTRERSMKIRDILRTKGHDVITIAPDQPVLAAVRVLSEHRIGALVVRDEGGVAGIISERDVLNLAAGDPARLTSTPVADVMTTNVIVGVPEDDLDYVMSIMTNNRIRHLPVLEGERLAGLVSIGDVVNAVRRSVEAENRHLKEYIQGVPR
jgi:uncharacterized protein